MGHGMVVAGAAKLTIDVAVGHYGIPRADLLAAVGLDPRDFADPEALIPGDAWYDLLRYVLRRTGDPALGIRVAEAVDLRTQGFWGYALLSSLTMRERLAIHMRYQRLRSTGIKLSFWTEGDRAFNEIVPGDIPLDVLPTVMDSFFFVSCIQARRRNQNRPPEMHLSLMHSEQPHHRELRALVSGPVVFGAPHYRFEFPASELDRRLHGDPHLGKLVKAQLDARLAQLRTALRSDILGEVRHRLYQTLSADPSLERIARDLRLSTRTLRRQLAGLGASFQGLLEEVRRNRAVEYLMQTDETIASVARRLGYGDPSNFRRAFRRWTGSAPRVFRRVRRTFGEASGRGPVE